LKAKKTTDKNKMSVTKQERKKTKKKVYEEVKNLIKY